MLDLSLGAKQLTDLNLKLFLVDLHRAQIRAKTPQRWVVKDIGGLYFSAADIGLTKRDVLRFISVYSNKSLRRSLSEDSEFWASVKQRAANIYRREHGCEANLVL